MTRVSMADARKDLAQIVNRAAYTHQRTVITRHDTDVAVVISIDEMRLLDALIEKWEDEEDIRDAGAALADAHEENIPWEAIKAEFSL